MVLSIFDMPSDEKILKFLQKLIESQMQSVLIKEEVVFEWGKEEIKVDLFS